jgi:preprotein translocase subunit SecY
MVSNLLSRKKILNTPTKKLLITLFLIFVYRVGNLIPLTGIDQEALKKAFLESENKNALLQVINMYSGGGGSSALLSTFSLGVIPFINASILVDLLAAFVPKLEKLQQEEGEAGKRSINKYKKILTVLFAIIQANIVIGYVKPYMYDTGTFSLILIGFQLVAGAKFIVWITNQIDSNGIGNGQSLIILLNILGTLAGKGALDQLQLSSYPEIIFLFLISALILISQTARSEIPIVSARQLSFGGNFQDLTSLQVSGREEVINTNSLSIKFNQAGIFPIIIASNILPFLTYFSGNNFPKFLSNILYYFFIVLFNYFYTTIFWDPDKISENLRKTSVAVLNTAPGKDTVTFLSTKVLSTSFIGGIGLCGILILYDFVKQITKSTLLNQLNISSLMIAIGVAFEIQKSLQALYKNVRFEQKQ